MKKIIAIPLLVLYVLSMSGMIVQLHFCGNKLSSWKVSEMQQQKASCCCMPSAAGTSSFRSIQSKMDDCCHTKTISLKITQDQTRVHQVQLQLTSLQSFVPAIFVFERNSPISFNPNPQAYQANAPPGLWQNIPLYKLHSRFTYYG